MQLSVHLLAEVHGIKCVSAGMEVHVLRDEGEDCPQSCTVNQWICSGLKEALMKRVLRKVCSVFMYTMIW